MYVYIYRYECGSRCFPLPRTLRICRSRPARSRPNDVRPLSMLVLSRPDDATRIYVLRTKLPGLTGYTRFSRSHRQFLCYVRYFCLPSSQRVFPFFLSSLVIASAWPTSDKIFRLICLVILSDRTMRRA